MASRGVIATYSTGSVSQSAAGFLTSSRMSLRSICSSFSLSSLVRLRASSSSSSFLRRRPLLSRLRLLSFRFSFSLSSLFRFFFFLSLLLRFLFFSSLSLLLRFFLFLCLCRSGAPPSPSRSLSSEAEDAEEEDDDAAAEARGGGSCGCDLGTSSCGKELKEGSVLAAAAGKAGTIAPAGKNDAGGGGMSSGVAPVTLLAAPSAAEGKSGDGTVVAAEAKLGNNDDVVAGACTSGGQRQRPNLGLRDPTELLELRSAVVVAYLCGRGDGEKRLSRRLGRFSMLLVHRGQRKGHSPWLCLDRFVDLLHKNSTFFPRPRKSLFLGHFYTLYTSCASFTELVTGFFTPLYRGLEAW
jgi:hypothetical protein